MPLIDCPDCGKKVSTEAVSCPGCGRPVKSAEVSPSVAVGGLRTSSPQQGSPPVVVQSLKSRGLFIILGLLLGCLGIHNFYAGYYGRGAAQLMITLVLGWVIVGFLITAIWALIEIVTVKVDAQGNPLS